MSTTQQVSAEAITVRPGEVLIAGVDFTRYGLATDELLDGTPIITPDAGSGLTTTSPSVNAATFTNRARGTVAIGKGVQFTLTVADSAEPGDYDVTVECATDGGQTLSGNCPVRVRER